MRTSPGLSGAKAVPTAGARHVRVGALAIVALDVQGAKVGDGVPGLSVLAHEDLRLLFMREGKMAGAVWPWLDDEMSVLARAQLLALMDAVGSSYAALPEDDRDALLMTFTAAARSSRTPQQPSDQQMVEATPDALRARVRHVEDRARERAAERASTWVSPSEEVLAIVRQVCADPAGGLVEASAAVLYREVGRLTAPLWITGDWDHVPELTLVAANSLDAAIPVVMTPDRRFDESRSEFFLPSDEEIRGVLNGVLLDSLRASRTVYFQEHPQPGPLPTDPHQRTLEQERRAVARSTATRQAFDAVSQITDPILEALTQYATERAAQEHAREQAAQAELIAARAEVGLARPEPQRYGVSARGAEFWVADALRWLGVHDAEVTQQASDGGVDVMSSRLAVSVKHYAGAVPVEEVREIFGVAMASRRLAVLWTSGSLTEAARQFAEFAPVAVVHYDVADATWSGLTASGAEFLESLDARLPTISTSQQAEQAT